MGLRFRRSFRLMPGIRLNFSKSGVSASLGRRGAWFTVGPKGARATGRRLFAFRPSQAATDVAQHQEPGLLAPRRRRRLFIRRPGRRAA